MAAIHFTKKKYLNIPVDGGTCLHSLFELNVHRFKQVLVHALDVAFACENNNISYI